MAKTKRICAVEGCGKHFHSSGYCSRHYSKFKTHGDPLGGRRGSSPGEPLRWIRDHANYTGDDCLKWPFEVGRYGYGTVKHNGKKRVASRVMCEVAHGDAPDKSMDAAHSCGNGHQACMNQKHLSWKTRKKNMADAIAHGTWKHGEMDPNTKLTRSDILEIRRLGASMLQKELAEMFGVRDNTISRILSRARWSWLD